MPYANIMVHLSPGRERAGPLAVAADLARRTSAYLIGVSACPVLVDASGISATAAAILEAQERDIDASFDRLEAQFHEHAGTPLREWRAKMAHPVDFIVEQGRAADLLVLGEGGAGPWKVDLGELLILAGRPILIVPSQRQRLGLEAIVVAWKNGPAAQRALAAAMPLLEESRRVCILGVGDEADPDELEDVAASVRRHGVHAEAVWRGRAGKSDAAVMVAFCKEVGSDLLVAGAYGRTRANEWLFGGVTRDLVREQPVCRLLMH